MAKKQLPEDTTQSSAELVGPELSGAQAALEQIPEWMREDVGNREGTEGIGKNDVQMPRLAIAQGLSPQLIRTNAAFIPDLRLGNLFNTLSGEVYGDGPIEIAIVRRDNPRWVEFDEDRNMIDPDVPADDPRTAWRVVDGERKPPIATQFYDFIIVKLDSGEPMVLSCARTAIPAAKRLNGLIMMRNPPIPLYAGRYTIATSMDKNDQGEYGVFVVKNAGTIKNKIDYEYVKSLYHSFKNVTINVPREAGDEEVGATSEAPPASTQSTM